MNVLCGIVGQRGEVFCKQHEIKSKGLVKMKGKSPSVDHVAMEDGTWEITSEKVDEQYAAEIATTDSLKNHAEGHEFDGDDERAARAWLQYAIARAEIKEKYGKGSTVFITETGDCYHKDQDCSALAGKEVKEVKLSVGLKNYESCTICADSE